MITSKLKSSIYFSVLCCALASPIWAAKVVKLVSAKTNITQLDSVLSQAKAKFPTQVPAADADVKMYASLNPYGNGGYSIDVGSTPDCAGAKMCSLGSLIIQNQKNITIYYDQNNQEMTSMVKLAKGIHGYYTKGFAMGDYWPANLQWREGSKLYTLSWDNVENKQVLMTMANSVIR